MKKARIIEIIILTVLFISLITGTLLYRHYVYIKPNTYNIYMKDIDSIVKGSPVRFMGINIGHVVRLKRKDGYIICRIIVTKKNVTIPDNTKAKVAFNGLAGSKSIELFPPEKDEDGVWGIVTEESLRINDFVNVVYDLKDVCTIINNFVQGIDPLNVSGDLKEITNPEIAKRVDNDMQRITDTYSKSENAVKNVAKEEKNFSNLLDKINKIFEN